VWDGVAVIETALTFSGWRWAAISALIDGSGSSLQVVGNILHAGAVRDTIIVGPFVDFSRVTTIAATTSVVVNNHLGI